MFSELALAFIHSDILLAASCLDDFVNTEKLNYTRIFMECSYFWL